MSHPHDPMRDIATAAIQAAPPVTVAYLTLNNLLAAISIAYVLLQAAYLVWKWRSEWRRRRPAEG